MNLFSIVTIVAECVNSGGILPMFRVEPVSLLAYFGPSAMFDIFTQVNDLLILGGIFLYCKTCIFCLEDLMIVPR